MLHAGGDGGVDDVLVLLHADLADGDGAYDVDTVAAAEGLGHLLDVVVVGLAHGNARGLPLLALLRAQPLHVGAGEDEVFGRDLCEHELGHASAQLAVHSGDDVVHSFLHVVCNLLVRLTYYRHMDKRFNSITL